MGSIDLLMPVYDVRKTYSVRVSASPEDVYAAVDDLDLSGSWLIRTLFALRGLPHREPLRLADLLGSGFVVLAQNPPEEVVLGVVGAFWRPGQAPRRIEPAGFSAFDEPGFAKAVWAFEICPIGSDDSRLITETRVVATDDRSRRAFRAYWFIVGPFSGLIRRAALRMVKESAEQPH